MKFYKFSLRFVRQVLLKGLQNYFSLFFTECKFYMIMCWNINLQCTTWKQKRIAIFKILIFTYLKFHFQGWNVAFKYRVSENYWTRLLILQLLFKELDCRRRMWLIRTVQIKKFYNNSNKVSRSCKSLH